MLLIQKMLFIGAAHSIKYHEQKSCMKFAFQSYIELGYLSKHVKVQFLVCQ